MPINPVNAQLVNANDTVTANLQGDPQVILSVAGTFTGAIFVVEATPLGQPAGTWVPVSEVRVDTGAVAGQIGPLSGGGLGSGLTMRADGGGYSAMRIRLVNAVGSGAVTGGIATVPFPYSASIQVVTGTVNVSGDLLKQVFAMLQAMNEPLGMNKMPLSLDLTNRPDPLLLAALPH